MTRRSQFTSEASRTTRKSGCVRKVLSDRSVQNGVEQAYSVRKVVSDRYDRSAHFRTSAASDGVSSCYKPSSDLYGIVCYVCYVSRDKNRSVIVRTQDQNYQPNQRVSERYGCNPGLYLGIRNWGGVILASGTAAPLRMAFGRAGGGCMEGSPPPATGIRGYDPRKFVEILHAKSCILMHYLWVTI
jgi:hypothetical protein